MSVDDPVAKKAEVKKEAAIEVKVMLSKKAERHSVKGWGTADYLTRLTFLLTHSVKKNLDTLHL